MQEIIHSGFLNIFGMFCCFGRRILLDLRKNTAGLFLRCFYVDNEPIGDVVVST